MYGLRELKPTIKVTEASVECPVLDCMCTVERQRHSFRRDARFRCPHHGIYISPSTFEYERETDNLLWCDGDDRALLQAIKTVKRESRIARDNSEDAVTWNVFRLFERTDTLAGLLSALLCRPISNPRVIYWSYDQQSGGVWEPLSRARQEFGERDQRGSEPDLIIVSDQSLIWIEAKVTALNETRPSNPPYSLPAYEAGGNGWFHHAFRSDPSTITNTAGLYELMRFWLLGSWIAEHACLSFHLVSLVLDRQEPDLVGRVAPYLQESVRRAFLRATWKEIYRYVAAGTELFPEREDLLHYFENKSLGYRAGALQAAFSVDEKLPLRAS